MFREYQYSAAEMMVPSAENPELSNVLPLKPGKHVNLCVVTVSKMCVVSESDLCCNCESDVCCK